MDKLLQHPAIKSIGLPSQLVARDQREIVTCPACGEHMAREGYHATVDAPKVWYRYVTCRCGHYEEALVEA